MHLLRSFFFLHKTKKMLLVCSPPEVLPPGSRAATINPTTRLLSPKRMHTTGAANLSTSLYDNNQLPSVLSICFTYLRLEMIRNKKSSPQMGQSKKMSDHNLQLYMIWSEIKIFSYILFGARSEVIRSGMRYEVRSQSLMTYDLSSVRALTSQSSHLFRALTLTLDS